MPRGYRGPAQRRVHQVRRGVVETDTLTASLIDIGLHRVTHFQGTAGDFTDMTNSTAVLLRIADREGEASAFQFAFIAYLTAGFRIERRLVRTTTAS